MLGRRSLCAFILLIPLRGISESVSDPAAAARDAFAARRYGQAVKLYSEALASQPRSAELMTDLGLAYQMEGRHDQAIESYRSALRVKDLQNTKELLAIEYCHLGEEADVLPLLAQLTLHLAADDKLLPLLASCYLDAGDSLDALRVGKLLMQSHVIGSDQGLVFNGRAYMAASRVFLGKLTQTAGAERYLAYVKQARDAGSTDARSGFAEAIAQAPYLRSDLTLEQGLALFSEHRDDPALLYVLSVLAGEQAMQSIVDCQTRFPGSPWLAQFRAQMLAAQGQPEEAIAIYSELLSSHPELPELTHELAMLYRKQGEWGKANELFHTELAADPADERAVTGISESLIQMGRYGEARDLLKPRFSSVPAPLWASMDLSLADQKLGKYEEAIDVLRRAEKSFPRDKTIHFRLMRLYTLTGQQDLAAKEHLLFGQEAKP